MTQSSIMTLSRFMPVTEALSNHVGVMTSTTACFREALMILLVSRAGSGGDASPCIVVAQVECRGYSGDGWGQNPQAGQQGRDALLCRDNAVHGHSEDDPEEARRVA